MAWGSFAFGFVVGVIVGGALVGFVVAALSVCGVKW